MSMNRSARVPAVPTPPRGDTIATYDTYLEAQKAVDHLSDKEFPVQHVTIVGTDLRMVERVTGRLTYSRVALAGLASGAWLGLFVGLLLWMFSGPEQAALPIFPAVAIGAAFGILFSIISYSFTSGKRDFTSSSQIVASTYAVLCAGEHAHRARTLLTELGGGRPMPTPARPVASTAPGERDPGVGQDPYASPTPHTTPHDQATGRTSPDGASGPRQHEG
ncbi:general stress protein [Actinotalea sp. K2]|uniref:general stress protein n=1 Tax=Actinotalea sp. K2 TaxID=2939438 RepID=UPI0020171BE1|nr:general stress protein [Actinotalea sp. K2]MCL3859869.1 hypothetical protein [Actinotalea sp. K2]